ncbi:MAG: hypothetical protein A2Y10_10565 [Planctomycetes bacterium GWF2_41_51]|nr:MAG: hypothetical protein A2Y10_10565 [Planctomycetes bacterium GWF2_41_51]
MRFKQLLNVLKVTLFLFVIFSSLEVVSAKEDTFFVPRAYAAVEVNQIPVLDGSLTDECWKNSEKTSNFVDYQTGQLTNPGTSFYVVYTQSAIYLGVEVEEPNTNQLVTKIKKYDGPVYNDDCIELFIQANPEQTAYYHLSVNSNAVRYDSLDQDPTIDILWSAAAKVDEGSWTLEVEIPYASLKVLPPEKGGHWKINICRTRQGAEISPKQHQNGCWSRLARGYHEPDGFGYLIFDNYGQALKAQSQNIKTKLEDISRLFTGNEQMQKNLKQFDEKTTGLSEVKSEEAFQNTLRDFHSALQAAADIADSITADANAQNNLASQNAENLILSKIDVYEPFLKDRISQLAYMGKILKDINAPIKLSYAQAINEYEHDSFVISAQAPVDDLTLNVSDLVSSSGDKISSDNVQCLMIGYLEPAKDDLGKYLNVNKEAIPELVEELRKPFSVKQMESRHIWVTINSIGAKAGDYKGTIEISADAKVLKSMPVEVKIWPFDLPRKPSLDLSIFTGIPWGGQSAELWARFLSEHYVSYVGMELPGDIYVGDKQLNIQGRDVKDLELNMDLTGKKITIAGQKWDNLERMKIMRKYGLKLHLYSGRGLIPAKLLPAYIEYLKQAGYGYDDMRYKVSDEDFAAWSIPIFKTFQEIDPKFNLMFCPAGDWDISVYQPYADCYMCSHSVGAWPTWLKFFQSEQAFGKKFAIYTNWPSWAGRAPALQGRKDLHWIWKINADEYTVWTMDIVPELNYAYGYSQYGAYGSLVNRPTEQQALATLVYFRNDNNVFHPVSSKRLEAIRDGVKDWIYLNILSKQIAKLQDSGNEDLLKQCRSDIEKYVKPGQKTQKEYNAGKEMLAAYIVKFNNLLNPYLKSN